MQWHDNGVHAAVEVVLLRFLFGVLVARILPSHFFTRWTPGGSITCATTSTPRGIPLTDQMDAGAANCIVGNGNKVPDRGQVDLVPVADGEQRANAVTSSFQIATVMRPTMSVSTVCVTRARLLHTNVNMAL